MARVEAAHGRIFAVTHSFDSAQRSDGIHSYEDRGTTYERWLASFRRKVVGRYQPMIDPSHHDRVVVSTVMPGVDDSSVALLGSEEHTSELQSLMRISYAVFCLK